MTEEMDAVMFDLGGTLIDLRPSKDVVFHRVLARHGYQISLEAVKKAIASAERRLDREFADLDGVNEERFWKKFDRQVLDTIAFKGDVTGFAKDLSAEFEQIVPNESSWFAYDDVWPILDGIESRGLKLGLISNATSLARRVSDHLGLSKYFKTMVISDEVGVRKPDRRIFELAARNVDLAPNRILYIGDKFEVDVVGARKAGMNSILIDRQDIYSDVDCIRIRSLNELGRYI